MIQDEKIIDKAKFTDVPEFTVEDAKKAMDYVVKKAEEGLAEFTDKFPSTASRNLFYRQIDNIEWVNGFWTGILWLCYEYSGKEIFRTVAEKQCESFKVRIDTKSCVDHHDLGFLYSPSCVAGYNLTGNEEMKETAIKAADVLLERYNEVGEFIQAWGEIGKDDSYRLIVDCMNNIPLLFWATEQTGDQKYWDVAVKHANTTLKNSIRENASTYHTFFFDAKTGAPKEGKTHQGYSDDSTWARGQAWGVSGFPIAYRYTKNPELMDVTIKLTNHFLNRLPADYVPYWDMIFNDGSGEVRDSSAAAIASCGLIETLTMYDGEYAPYYKCALDAMMRSLAENYTSKDVESNGILLHGVYAMPFKDGVDECNIWGDYYYAEALMNIINPDRKLCW